MTIPSRLRGQGSDHVALAAAWKRHHPDHPDDLLYVSRPGDGQVRYVWVSGVQLGICASTLHLLDLWSEDIAHDHHDA